MIDKSDIKQWLDRILCRHSYLDAENPYYESSLKLRKCSKCGKGQVGGYASDGRFYWVKYDGDLDTIKKPEPPK